MSAGVLIFAAGDKGQRYLTSNCRLMCHSVSGGSYGNISELQTSMDEITRLQNSYFDLLGQFTGTSVSKWKGLIANGDYYFGAKEAVKLGVADKIINTNDNRKKFMLMGATEKKDKKAEKGKKAVKESK